MTGLHALRGSWPTMLVSIVREVRYAFREALPWPRVRATVLALVFIFEASMCLLPALYLPRTSRPLASNVIAGLLGLNLVFATGAATHALARLLAAPARLMLFQLAPISERMALAHLLAPSVFAALCPVSLIGFPFAAFAVPSAPWFALGLAAMGMAAFSWAVLIAIAAACWLGRRFGRARGAQLLRSLSYLAGFGSLLAFNTLSRLDSAQVPLLALVIATPVVLPPLAAGAIRSLVAMLSGTESTPEAKEPVWGSAGWGRLVVRSLSLPILIAAAIPLLALLLFQPSLRPVLASLCVVQLVAVPLDRLFEAEMEMPDRLRLAPEGAAYRLRLIARCGGISCVAALLLASSVALDGGHWRWFTAVGAAALFVPVTFFIGPRAIRMASQFVLLVAAVSFTALWSH